MATGMNSDTTKPHGHLLLRTLAMPGDTNPNGDIFGGWILSQMDIAGGILAKELAKGRVVTIGINAMKFMHPVHVGDTVGCYGKLLHTGTTSITLHLQVWVKTSQGEHYQVTEADFTYVAIDADGKKRPLASNP